MAALVFLSGPAAGLRHEVIAPLTIGRSRVCEIMLDDDKVSRHHARIDVSRGQLRLRDLDSRNGTRVNGQRIASEVVLLDGDRIQLGDSTARIELAPAVMTIDEPADLDRWSMESVLADSGADGAIHLDFMELLRVASEPVILRRAAAALAEKLGAPRVAAFLVGANGLAMTRVVASPVDVPRELISVALERDELLRAGRILCIPLVSSRGERLGAICAERCGEAIAGETRAAAVLGRLTAEALAAARERTHGGEPILIGTAAGFKRLVERAGRVALGDEAVSIFGEPGSGRSEMARYVHWHSTRSYGPLITVNCADDGSRDELFGSGGLMDSKSALSRADGGTLVLRHLELLKRPLAQRLARLLGARSVPLRRGEQRFDVRTIVIGRNPLQVLADQRKIPRELAKALPGAKLDVPSLRERSTDVPLLFKFFARELCRQLGREPPRLSAEARRALMAYSWPSNVSELRLVAERLALLYPGLEVPVIRLPAEVLESGSRAGAPTLHGRIRAVERTAIAEALSAAGGKKIRAAEILGISRPTLDKKLRELHLATAGGPGLTGGPGLKR